MRESEAIRIGINNKQKEWQNMNLSQKRQSILFYWQDIAKTACGAEKRKEVLNQIFITRELDMPEIESYLESVHQAIMEDAKRLEKEAKAREGD